MAETFIVGALRGATVLLKLKPEAGYVADMASEADFHRAIALGVACLNTGKSDRELMRKIAEVTTT